MMLKNDPLWMVFSNTVFRIVPDSMYLLNCALKLAVLFSSTERVRESFFGQHGLVVLALALRLKLFWPEFQYLGPIYQTVTSP